MRAELHFHILPAVDDGPRDMAEAVELGRLAAADGTRTVTATPHVHALLERRIIGELGERVGAVQAALDEAGVPLRVLTGAELFPDDLPGLDDDDLEAIAQGPAGRRWVLIEAPLFGAGVDELLAATAELRSRGFGTLIGHPERCDSLMQADGAIARELADGARLQVNASSLLGRHGEPARGWGIELARAGDAHLLASDAHGVARPPLLTAALAVLADAGLPAQRLEPLVADGPRALLAEGIAPRAHAAER